MVDGRAALGHRTKSMRNVVCRTSFLCFWLFLCHAYDDIIPGMPSITAPWVFNLCFDMDSRTITWTEGRF
jgi:hypothetical protein